MATAAAGRAAKHVDLMIASVRGQMNGVVLVRMKEAIMTKTIMKIKMQKSQLPTLINKGQLVSMGLSTCMEDQKDMVW